MISWAARCWKTDRFTATRRLIDHGVLDNVTTEDLNVDLQWYAFQESVTSLWQNCRQPRPNHSGDLRWAAFFLGINWSSAGLWFARAARFAGVLSKDEILVNLPNFSDKSRQWEEAVAVALYSLPGKLSSFFMVLRSASEDNCVLYRIPDPSGLECGGFLGLDAVTGPTHPDFGNKILLLSDPLLALKLHDIHVATDKYLLPVAGFCHEDAVNLNVCSGMFAGKEVHVWGPNVTEELSQGAKKVDSRIVTNEDSKVRYVDDISWTSLHVWISHKLRLARPWPEVLAAYLECKSRQECGDVLGDLQLSDRERDALLECCTASDKERLKDIERERNPSTVNVGHRMGVVERSGCWFLLDNRKPGEGQGLLWSDAILRIDKIVRFPRNSKMLYEGRIVYKGHEIPFSVPAGEQDKVHRHTASWIRGILLDAGLGVLHYVPSKDQRLVDVALALHKPVIVAGRDRCGWDKAENAFVFDGFSISAKGHVETGVSVHGSNLPGRNLHLPRDFTREQIEVLSDSSPLGSLVWCVTACVLANLLAPLFSRNTTGIALLGEGASLLGPMIAKAVGCVESRYSAENETRHGWPIVLPAVKEQRLARELTATDSHNCVVATSLYAAAVFGIEAGWNWVICDYAFTSLDQYGEVLPLIVPAFLVWLAQQEFRLPQSCSHAESILISLGEWVKSLGGKADHLQRSTSFLSPDQPEGCRHKVVAQRFVGLLCRMLADSYVKIGPNITSGMVVGEHKVLLPKREIYRALGKRKLPFFDSGVVIRALYEDGILLGEEDVDGIPVWSLDPAWWKETHEQWIKSNSNKFRVEK
jgi:hypothetical protein